MDCYLFTAEHVKNNIQLLLNAAKSAAKPYQIGYGPIIDKLTVVESTETEVRYYAEILEKIKFQTSQQNTIQLLQSTTKSTNLLERILKSSHGWVEIDDNDPYISTIEFGIPIEGLDPGKHILTLQACSQDED